MHFAIGVLHTGQAHGGNAHGHFGLDAGHLGSGAAVFHVHCYALAQLDFLEVVFVGAVGAFGP